MVKHMENGTDELVKSSTIVVVGNGLDLHCGLRSSFKNFFDSKLSYGNGVFKKEIVSSNIWYLIFVFAFMLPENRDGYLVPFVKNDNPLWMDVENYIDKVFKNINSKVEPKIYGFINFELHKKLDPFEYDSNSGTLIEGGHRNQKYLIGKRVNELRYKLNNPEDLLMEELKRFEKDFTIYMKEQIEINNETYEQNLKKFLSNELGLKNLNDLFILSFNYSTNFKNIIKADDVASQII